ncbi:MAG: MBL fold metallo-hydrolase [Sphingobacteriaceae bacterium]|nr:MAG: MBL fold metallo-hydrolase [Sphingobacteriaceae bacterium]
MEVEGKNIVIDTGPDFRYQMLRANVQHLDAIIFTHEHKDHTAGLDDVRAFNYKQQEAMDIYAVERVQTALKREFAYVFENFKYPGIPQLNLHAITTEPFYIGCLKVIPIEVLHYKLPVLGFRIGDFTYITDAKTISDKEKEKIKGSKVLVINALQKETHISHFTFDEAVALARELGIEKTYFTHISHRLGRYHDILHELPPGIELAYDSLQLYLD